MIAERPSGCIDEQRATQGVEERLEVEGDMSKIVKLHE